MTLDKLLSEFYKKNRIPIDGGINKNTFGVMDLKISKSKLMKIEYDQLIGITTEEKTTEMGIIKWIQFLFWSLISQMIFLFPLILIICVIIWLKK